MSDGPTTRRIPASDPQRTVVMDPGGGDRAEGAILEEMVGRVFSGRYRVLELIAAGGFGAVFRGEHVHMHHAVAIKVLLPHTENLPQRVDRFEREAVAGARVRHPSVNAATDFGREDDGTYFLILELAAGRTLDDAMSQGPMAIDHAVGIAIAIGEALAAIHDAGIVHRDLKPSNVMLTEDGGVKLLDFGLAKLEDRPETPPAKKLTAADMVLGTVTHMAPEIVHGAATLDGRADLYALGVMLYEMLTGRHPFDDGAATAPMLFAAHCTRPVPAMAERAPEVSVPPALEAITRRLLAKDPTERPAPAAGACAALAEAKAAPRAPEAPAPAVTAPAGRLVALGVAVVAITIALVLGIASLAKDPSSVAGEPAPSARASGSSSGYSPIAVPSLAPAVTEIDGRDADAWRTRLLKAVTVKHWMGGAEALIALAKLRPEAFADEAVRDAAVDVAVGIAEGPDDVADRVFDALTAGERAPIHAVLWHLVRYKPSTRGAARARSRMQRDDVRARLDPDITRAYDLRRASCLDKTPLFAEAGRRGGRRVLGELQFLAHNRCSNPHHACCFRGDETLADAIDALEARLRAAPP